MSCTCHVVQLPNRRTGQAAAHAPDCPAALATAAYPLPADFTLEAHEARLGTAWPVEDFELGAAALLWDYDRATRVVSAMAALLDAVGVALTGRAPDDYSKLPEVAERTATALRLMQMATGLGGRRACARGRSVAATSAP